MYVDPNADAPKHQLSALQVRVAEMVTRAVADGTVDTRSNGDTFYVLDGQDLPWIVSITTGHMEQTEFRTIVDLPDGRTVRHESWHPADPVHAAQLADEWDVCPELRQYERYVGDVRRVLDEIHAGIADGRTLHTNGAHWTFVNPDATAVVRVATFDQDPGQWTVEYERMLTDEARADLARRPTSPPEPGEADGVRAHFAGFAKFDEHSGRAAASSAKHARKVNRFHKDDGFDAASATQGYRS